MQKMAGSSFPEEVLEHVFSFIQDGKDRNVISLVCKSWYEIERWSRRRVFVGNCYAISPRMVIRRFPEVRSVELKGKPHFADFSLVPDGWGGYVGRRRFGSSAWWSRTRAWSSSPSPSRTSRSSCFPRARGSAPWA